ncbi:MAG: hypothetical protein IT167_30825 [Bryobacterales bacterium]|nr:hypothetical protein [Bryobacterales bacterium]
MLGDPAEVAGVTPIGGLGGLALMVVGQAAGDALQQVLGVGVPFGVAACGGLFGGLGFGVPHREPIHHFGGD